MASEKTKDVRGAPFVSWEEFSSNNTESEANDDFLTLFFSFC